MKIKWDYIFSGIKCRVDNENKINVYYQNSFNFDEKIVSIENLFKAINLCQNIFINNDYPIVVLEDANGGGKLSYSILFTELVQNLFNNQLKCSIKIGKYTSTISNDNSLYSKFLKENGEIHKKKNF